MGEASAQLLKRYIVNFTETGHIPPSEVSHIIINKEIVWLNVVRPTIQFVIAPAIPFSLYHKTGDKKLFHAPGIYLSHAVELHIALQDGRHCFSVFLLIAVSRRAGRLFGLTAVHAEYRLHHSADKVVF